MEKITLEEVKNYGKRGEWHIGDNFVAKFKPKGWGYATVNLYRKVNILCFTWHKLVVEDINYIGSVGVLTAIEVNRMRPSTLKHMVMKSFNGLAEHENEWEYEIKGEPK